MNNVVIVTGELSGENHAVSLVRELGRLSAFAFSGVGSTALARADVHLVHDYHDISLVGFEILTKMRHIRNAYRILKTHLETSRPDLVILVDFPGFNLLLLSRLTKKLGIPTIYFIPPQLWSWWTEGRIKMIRERIDLVLCIFPFEEEMYRSRHVPVEYVGHPYVSSVRASLTRSEFCRLVGVDPGKRLVTMMAGSRESEVKKHLPILHAVNEELSRRMDNFSILLPVADSLDTKLFGSFVAGRKGDFIPVKGHTYDCLAFSDAALVKSGSSTLEAALLGVPSVVYYRLSWFSYHLARMVAKVPYIALPNLIAGKEVFPEFVQNVEPAAIAESLVSMIENGRSAVRKDLDGIRERLSTAGHDPYQTAADRIVTFLERKNATLPKTSEIR
jgi:lipid-A-disaccharide synthase